MDFIFDYVKEIDVCEKSLITFCYFFCVDLLRKAPHLLPLVSTDDVLVKKKKEKKSFVFVVSVYCVLTDKMCSAFK